MYHWYWIPWPQQWMRSVCHGRIWTQMPSHQQPSWVKWWRSCRLPMQENHSNYSRVAQHALVWGSSGHVPPNPTETAQPVNTALQSDPSQKSDKSKSPCMTLRALAIKEQGFSEVVASRIKALQRGSTSSVSEAKWTIFTKWCLTHQVDFRAPTVNSVADLLYLCQVRKLLVCSYH